MYNTILYSIIYGSAIAGVVLLLFLLIITIIWITAFTGKFFTFIREGEGIAIKKGEGYHKSIIAFDGHHLHYDETLKTNGVTEGREKTEGFIGFLKEYLGIYWVGFWPVISIYKYEFRWKEWSSDEDGYKLKSRTPSTSFFFVKTFRYASFLQAAEAKGNISVDVKFSLFVRIVYPQIALFRAEDWFLQLDDYVLRRARIYVGELEFDELRTETGEVSKSKFSDCITKLNLETSANEDGVIQRLGVKIISAQIVEVDISGTEEEKRKNLEATTEKYRKEQEGAGIIALGNARAKAIQAEGRAIKELEDIGAMLRRQQAIEKAGEGGNIVVFTNDSNSSTLTTEKVAGLITAQLNKNKGGRDEKEK